jgi:hypothetical protein
MFAEKEEEEVRGKINFFTLFEKKSTNTAARMIIK